MAPVATFQFTRIKGCPVKNDDDVVLGKVLDLIAEHDAEHPRIIGMKLSASGGVQTVAFSQCRIEKGGNGLLVRCTALEPFEEVLEGSFELDRHILDHQIVDMNGRRLVKVSDLRLADLADGTYVVAVDAGFEGFLRRRGLATPLKKLVKPFGIQIPVRTILWSEVEPVEDEHAGLRLAREDSNLKKLHPADLADILEDLDEKTQKTVFAALDDEKAADVLEELEPEAQVSLLESLPVSKAADLLEIMPADEVADILDEMHEVRAEALLNEMDSEASEEVRELMDYPDNSVGSIMSTDFFAFTESHTVEETIRELRRMKPEPDMIYYLYVVDHEDQLLGIVSLRDIIISEPEVKLSEIMNEAVVYVRDTDRIDTLGEVVAKYSLLAVPVVDLHDRLVGMAIINDIVHTLLKSRRKRL